MAKETFIVWESRADCPAPAHDTRQAWSKHKCRCEKARQAKKDGCRKYYQNNIEKVRASARRRWRSIAQAQGRDPQRIGRPTYADAEAMSDWVIVKRIVDHGPQADASLYDKCVAVTILTDRWTMTARQIAEQTGYAVRTVQRIQKWMRENVSTSSESTQQVRSSVGGYST